MCRELYQANMPPGNLAKTGWDHAVLKVCHQKAMKLSHKAVTIHHKHNWIGQLKPKYAVGSVIDFPSMHCTNKGLFAHHWNLPQIKHWTGAIFTIRVLRSTMRAFSNGHNFWTKKVYGTLSSGSWPEMVQMSSLRHHLSITFWILIDLGSNRMRLRWEFRIGYPWTPRFPKI